MRPARALLLAISLYLHHALADQSTTTLTSTTTVATTTVTLTLSRKSGVQTTTETIVGPTTIALASASALTSTKPSSTMSSSSDSLASSVLNSTNIYRQHYEARNLTWNSTLANYAQDYAKNCVWKHSGGPYGENLAANFESPTLAIDAWGNEESEYSYEDRKFTEKTGHFTQLVWQNTTSVGCGLVQCDNDAENGVKGAYYLVCEYSPRGNVKGQFGYNVGKSGAANDGEPGFGGAEGRCEGLRRSMAALVAAYVLLAILF